MSDTYGTDIAFGADFVVTAGGDLQTITGLDNLTSALLRRLVTQPGSLIHRPDYGVGIKDFQNALSSLANQQKLATLIKEQFETDPRIESVLGVQVILDDYNPSQSQILVRLQPIGYTETTMTFKPFGDN